MLFGSFKVQRSRSKWFSFFFYLSVKPLLVVREVTVRSSWLFIVYPVNA